MFEGLARLLDIGQEGLAGFFLVFVRVGAVVGLLPGFGDRVIPARIKLAVALSFSLIVWPLLAPDLRVFDEARPYPVLIAIEAGVGFLVGISIRLMVMALQFAGSIAAQSTALAQMFGGGVTPDPMPAIGNILMLAGTTLAVVTGLHVKAAIAMAGSYETLPIGMVLPASDVAAWGTAHVARTFALGFSLAAPFVIAAFAYNLALGAINKAMPQLMVAFIGAPAITAGGMLLLMLAAPVMLRYWNGQLDALLMNPLAMPR